MQYFAVHWIYLTIIRMFTGFGNSMLMTIGPMLFSEFVKPEIRGVFHHA